jgi:hypothetical protein
MPIALPSGSPAPISLHRDPPHLTHIYAKTRTRRRAEVVRYALDRAIRISR